MTLYYSSVLDESLDSSTIDVQRTKYLKKAEKEAEAVDEQCRLHVWCKGISTSLYIITCTIIALY
ncbi:hypothetical protein DPMN_036543 [Dreissena polymorpha]|uniref:Uncharacterized protein n=1 Tax=Dreissena polymorpha TaxID=45954 RepID=A0A9D4MDR9_DREPO|nr:hypothetical protein DPMN_036543 [Dreissena polymorpha]